MEAVEIVLLYCYIKRKHKTAYNPNLTPSVYYYFFPMLKEHLEDIKLNYDDKFKMKLNDDSNF